MEEKKGFAAEFKEFIMRGNVMDMAVGIIIGGAFTAIVTSLVNDILMPVIGAMIGGVNFSKLCVTFGKAQIMYGNFIMAIINFVLIALVIFSLIKTMNKLRRPAEEPAEEAAPEEPAADIVLLGEIRDLLKNK